MGTTVLTSYLSHGAPTSLVERTGIHDVYEGLGRALTARGVDTVVVSSPHYYNRGNFQVESRERIPCIQDYYGFAEELYKYSYEAANNLALVEEIVKSSAENGLQVDRSQSWGLDHGAWLPLYFMFPGRNVRVVPVSIDSSDPETHFKFGEAIRSAIERTEGTFAIIGTGSPVHRLDLIRFGYYGEEKFEPGEKFDEKLIEVIATGDTGRILKMSEEFPSLFQAAAPEGNLNPLYVALGASGMKDYVGKTLYHDFMYYGVSLMATVLSAEQGLWTALAGQDRKSSGSYTAG